MQPKPDYSRRKFLKTGVAASLAFYAMPTVVGAEEEPVGPGMLSSTTYGESSSAMVVGNPAKIRILQLTDAHFFQPRKEFTDGNERTVGDWKRMVDRYKPDLVAMTGDLWTDNPDGRGAEFQSAATTWLGELGVPWLFTWGNHDRLDENVKGHDIFHDAPNSLYRGGPQQGNYTVSLRNAAGDQVWELLCLNTHRGGVVGDSYEWLKRLNALQPKSGVKAVPAFALFHIPLKQYADLRENGGMSGFAFEKVCNENEDGAALKELVTHGNVRACFCGHDHVNDYSGVVDGIELVYGRSSGWNAYGFKDVRKGAKLITANAESGSYAWETVFPDGLRWHPEAGKRIEEIIDEPWLKPTAEMWS